MNKGNELMFKKLQFSTGRPKGDSEKVPPLDGHEPWWFAGLQIPAAPFDTNSNHLFNTKIR